MSSPLETIFNSLPILLEQARENRGKNMDQSKTVQELRAKLAEVQA